MQLGSMLHSCSVGRWRCRCTVPERRLNVIGTCGKAVHRKTRENKQRISESFLASVFRLAEEARRQDRIGFSVVRQFGGDENPLDLERSLFVCRTDLVAVVDDQKLIAIPDNLESIRGILCVDPRPEELGTFGGASGEEDDTEDESGEVAESRSCHGITPDGSCFVPPIGTSGVGTPRRKVRRQKG